MAAQKKVVETEIKELQKRKESARKMLDVEMKAKENLVKNKIILQTYNIAELRVLLTYYQVKCLSGMKKDAMAEKWKDNYKVRKMHQFSKNGMQMMKSICRNSPQSQSF